MDFHPNLPADSQILEFADYIYDTYVAGIFPPTMWAAYDAESIRTTNACEAFHSRINQMFYHAHPHIFSLVDVLMEIQNLSYLKMQNPPKVNVHPRQKVIADEMKKLDEGVINRYAFVKALAQKF
ncbi:hypothetical protein V9T40_014020 [Parthenolecanium corni]|uniref:Uncharacterized protein n=1 Tax=Parthenolecanium corni TaxID=536013 RepID=A0AAN9TQ49_9HEMI